MNQLLILLFVHSLWWLLFWMLLAFLLGWLLRRLFQSKSGSNDYYDELQKCRRRYAQLETKYNDSLKSSSVSTSSRIQAQTVSAEKDAGPFAKLENTNLQIVEGIGDKMEGLLKKNKVTNWSLLANETPNKLRALLDNEDKQRYQFIDPSTWPKQAKLADNSKWDDLINYQKDLGKKKDSTDNSKTESKVERIMIQLNLLKRWKQDDLKAIEGIGPKVENLLHNAGIKTWKDLADTSINRLKEVIDSGGDRFKLVEPDTWAKQAKMAHEGKFKELQRYQDTLDGGKVK